MRYIRYLLPLLLIFGCMAPENELSEMKEYDGPVLEVENVETLYSDSAKVIMKLIASRQFEFQNGDREFPNDFYIEFYDKQGEVSSSLKSNKAFYYKEQNLWKAVGDVVLKSEESGEKLNTEELFWDPKEQEIYSEEFVRIESEGEILMGEGLEAKQNFSSYRILNPTGTVFID